MHRAHQPWLLALALAVGCAPGKSELSVTVDATGMIASLDHLQVALTDSTGRHAGPYSIAVPGGTIPPSTNFALAFSKDVHGTVNVTVSAVDNAGSSLASGAGDVDVQPSHQANLTVTLAGGTTGGDGGDTTDMAVIPGYHLVFSVQPSNTNVATPLSPSVSVVLTDGNGATIPVSDPVTLAIVGNAGGARLNGVTTVAAINGVATFDNIAVDRAGTALTLTATANSYAAGTSTAFNVAGNAWQPSYGLNGGTAREMQFDPGQPNNVVAVATGGALFKSTDGGKTWFPIGYGIPAGTLPLTIAMDPVSSGTMYVGTTSGVYKTTNGGGLFTQLTMAPTTGINNVVVDPQTPTNVYVLAQDATGMYKSSDGGVTFAPANTGLPANPFALLLLDPHAPSNLIGLGLKQYWSSDGAAHWNLATTGLTHTAGVVWGGAIDPTTPGVAYYGIGKTTDGGKNWTALTNTPPLSAAIVADPKVSGTIYYFGLNSFGGALYRTTDGGSTYSKLLTLAIPGGNDVALAIDPMNTNNILFSAPELDIQRSSDSAATWTKVAQGFTCVNVASVSIDANNAATVYAATHGDGVMQSKDGGRSWVRYDTGLTTPAVTVVATDPAIAGRVWAGINAGTTSQPLLWEANSGTWMSVAGTPTSLIRQIAFEAKATDEMYAVAGGALYSNATASSNWTQVTTPASATAVATDPTVIDNVYVSSSNIIYRGSARAGFTQATTTPNLTENPSIVIDPTAPSTVYLLTTGGTSVVVNKTTNAFANMASSSNGLTGIAGSLLTMDPRDHMTLWLVGNHLYKTTDAANSWSPAEGGLSNVAVQALAIDGTTAGIVYAGTTCGAYKTTSGGK